MSMLWRRTVRVAVGGFVLLLAACGGDGGGVVPETEPPGRVIPGTGPVADDADALARLLTQVLGLTTARQDGVPVVGTGGDPFVNLYAAADGPLPRGTQVSDSGPDLAPIALNRPYYLFWLDPNPLAQLGHPCFLLYVDPSDGRIIESPVEFDPQIGDTTPLLFREDKQQRLRYAHQIWLDELARDSAAAAGRQVLGNGQNAHGLHVSGDYAFSGQADIDNVAEFLQDLTGEANPLSLLLDRKNDRIDKDDLAAALRTASRDLGIGDKFYFTITSHASKSGKVGIGTDFITWAELCRLLNENVSAQYLNIVISACYSGLADAAFAGWDAETDKGVRWVTATSDTNPSYADGDGSYSIRCALKHLKAALATAREDGSLTVAELEQAMADLGVNLTGDEIRQKICDKWQPINPAWWADFEQDDGPGDKVRPQGDPKVGGFDPAPPPPVEVPQHILDLLERLRQARLADDPIVLGPLYHPDYLYDGKTHQQIVTPPPGQDTIEFEISNPMFFTGDGDDWIQVDVDRTIHLTGTSPIESEQEGTRVFGVTKEPSNAQIVSERLALWRQFDRGGTLGLQAPPPGLPVIDDLEVNGFPVDSFFDVFVTLNLSSGADTLPVRTQITFTGLERQLNGTAVNGVFASLGATTVQLRQEGQSNTYAGEVPVPRQVGRWVLSISASTRISDGQTSNFVSSAVGRSLEIVVAP